jgi:hypothetical protein
MGKFSRLALWLAMALAPVLPLASAAQAQSAHIDAKFELAFDCEQPIFVRNYPMHAVFTGTLNANRSATADLALSGPFINNTIHFDARLGGGTRPAPGGSARLSVISSSRLRAVWDLPNNQLILDIIVRRSSCSTVLAIRLKPGQHQYSMYSGTHFHYCSAYRLISSSCEAH